MILVVMMCRGAAAIVVANGCGDHDRVWTAVEAAIKELDPPAGHFPNEVPALALAAAIDVGGPCTVAVASDVINVTDPGSQNGSLHVWSRNLMSLASQPSKSAPNGVAADNRASPIGLTIRSGEEATPPFSSLAGGKGSLARGLLAAARSQGSCGTRIIGIDQRVERHHQLQLNVDVAGGGLSGDSFDEGVGHHLVPGSTVTGRYRGVGCCRSAV